MKENNAPSNSNTDVNSVASHSCTEGNSIRQIINRVKHGLWQLSLGTTGFEETTVFSEYVVKKSKELIGLLNSVIVDERSVATKLPQGEEAGIKKDPSKPAAQPETAKAGDAWKNYIQQFEKLNEFWNNLPETTSLWLSQQIDIFAGKYPAQPAITEQQDSEADSIQEDRS